MGDDNICHSGGLVGAERARHIISFGEDESGKSTSTDKNGCSSYKYTAMTKYYYCVRYYKDAMLLLLGELYILTTSRPSPTSRRGVVYQVIEPQR